MVIDWLLNKNKTNISIKELSTITICNEWNIIILYTMLHTMFGLVWWPSLLLITPYAYALGWIRIGRSIKTVLEGEGWNIGNY